VFEIGAQTRFLPDHFGLRMIISHDVIEYRTVKKRSVVDPIQKGSVVAVNPRKRN
jgi:hypothetical protein